MRRAGRWWHHGGRKRWMGFGGERGGTAGKERGVGAHEAALAAAAAAGVAGVMDAATGRRGPLQRYPFTAARSWPVPLWIAARLASPHRTRQVRREAERGGREGGGRGDRRRRPPTTAALAATAATAAMVGAEGRQRGGWGVSHLWMIRSRGRHILAFPSRPLGYCMGACAQDLYMSVHICTRTCTPASCRRTPAQLTLLRTHRLHSGT